MTLDPLLIEVLACPEDKGPLLYFADEDRLYNPRLHRSYAVRDGIPVMLIDEATAVDDAEHARLMAKAEAGGARTTGATADRERRPEAVGPPRPVPAGRRLPRHVGCHGRPPRAGRGGGVGGPGRRRTCPGTSGSRTSWSWAWAAAGSPATCWPRRRHRSCRSRSPWSRAIEPPDYVGTGSLVFAVSFSGDTEETLEAAAAAFEAGASLIVVAGGGALVQSGRRVGRPARAGAGRRSPSPGRRSGRWPSPRWCCWRRSGSSPAPSSGSTRPSTSSGAGGTSWIRPGNRAEELARRIGRTIPLVHSSGDLGAAAALRWKAQINENAKSPAFCNVHPELCHNEVAGWGQNGDATRQLITLVNLRHDAEHPQVSRRFDLVAEVLREVVADVVEVRAAGEGDLAQLLDLALIGDFVSLHLAGQRGDRSRARSRCSTSSSDASPPAAPEAPSRAAGRDFALVNWDVARRGRRPACCR